MRHTELARAKINLALHVLGRRPDGYHELDSIVAFADIADRLVFEPARDWRLDLSGPFAAHLPPSSDNLVFRTIEALERAFPGKIAKARITLEKNLPIAAGIGGGSADAAACLRGIRIISGFSNEPADFTTIGLSLGADVPACLAGKTCRMRGLGDRIESFDGWAPLPALLANPKMEVATRDVFAKLALAPDEMAFAAIADARDLASCRNDLTGAALALAPAIGDVLTAIEAQRGLRFARMSGSGPTCFGVFTSKEAAAEAARNIAGDHQNWWVKATMIG